MADKAVYKIKGHEKFSLREGWLNKGILSVKESPKVFLGNDGPDILGVGNNMVKSIRYWMQAFDLIEESPKDGAKLSQLGELIWEEDVFFEDIFTLWVLHSNLVKNIEKSTVWYMFFNRCSAEEFDKTELFNLIKMELFKYIGINSIPDGSIKDDIDVLINMYTKGSVRNDDPEDKNVSPFAALGLIKKEDDKYFRMQPDLRKINEWVILYEISCMFEKNGNISIDAISVDEKSIGSIYNLSRVTINGYLDRLESMGYIKVNRTAGLDMVYPVSIENHIEVMNEYYKQRK